MPAPNQYAYYQLKGINKNNAEERIINKSYGLFHGEQPLMESIHNNLQSGKNLNLILKSIYYFRGINKDFVQIRLYKVIYDFKKFKSHLSQSESIASLELIGQYPNE